MKSKMAAAVVLSVFILSMAAPFLVQDAEALNSDDYYVTVPGTQAPSKTVYITMGNGESHTWQIFVVNVSEKYLDVYYDYSVESKDAKITDHPEATLIGPEGSSEPSVAKGSFTVLINELSDGHDSLKIGLTVHVMDVSDPDTVLDTEIVFDIKVLSIYDNEGVYNKFFGIIPNNLPEPLNSAWVTATVTVLTFSLIAWLIGTFLISKIVLFVSSRISQEDAHTLQRKTRWLIVGLVTLLATHLGVRIIDEDPVIISTVSLWLYVFCIILVALILWRVYSFIIETALRNIEKANLDSAIDTSLIPLFKMIGMIIFWVGGISAVLAAFHVDLQGILVSAGVISLGITLGAQNVLSQFFSGLVILITRPFRPGDYLKINDTVYIVKTVKLMYTEFTNWAGDAIITMPNNVVSSATINNMTKGDVICKQYVYFSVAYGTDLNRAQEVMKETAAKCDLVVHDRKHDISTRVTNFLSSGVEIRLSVYAPTFDDTGDVAGRLRGLVYEAFAENGIEIPYDRVQIDILSDHSEKEDKT